MPISDYYKIWHGRGSPRSHPHAKSQPPKSPKLLIFGINLSPYAIIFTKFGLAMEFQVRTLVANFTVMALNMWATAYSPKIAPKGIPRGIH